MVASNKETERSLFKGIGTEIEINSDDNFLKIKETLTRVGIVTEKNKLMQTCYILHKKGRYSIVHYKELLLLDRINVEIEDIDVDRRRAIAGLLQQWNLLTIVNPQDQQAPHLFGIKVVPYRERANWTLFSLYNIGRK